MKKPFRIIAHVELDMDEIVSEIKEQYGTEDITVDDVLEYVNENITYLKGNGKGIYRVESGPAISAFTSADHYRVDELLEQIMGADK